MFKQQVKAASVVEPPAPVAKPMDPKDLDRKKPVLDQIKAIVRRN